LLNPGRLRRSYVWLTGLINCPMTSSFQIIHIRNYTPVKYMILSIYDLFIATYKFK